MLRRTAVGLPDSPEVWTQRCVSPTPTSGDGARPADPGAAGRPRRREGRSPPADVGRSHARQLRPRVASRGRRGRHGFASLRTGRPPTSCPNRGRPAVLARGRAGQARAALADGRAESPLETRGRLRIVGAGLDTRAAGRDPPATARRRRCVVRGGGGRGEFDGRVKYTDPWRGRSPRRSVGREEAGADCARSRDRVEHHHSFPGVRGSGGGGDPLWPRAQRDQPPILRKGTPGCR